MKLTDTQRELIRDHSPEKSEPAERSGRKPIAARKAPEAALWILETDAQ